MIPRIEKVIEAFREAGQDLGIDVVAPFDLLAAGRHHRFLAFIPHFGGPRGMVVAEIDSDRTLYRFADEAGYYVSFVSAEAYDRYDRTHFIDTLKDWGFYGPEEKRPPWLNDAATEM